jgi:hypothetical protein
MRGRSEAIRQVDHSVGKIFRAVERLLDRLTGIRVPATKLAVKFVLIFQSAYQSTSNARSCATTRTTPSRRAVTFDRIS